MKKLSALFLLIPYLLLFAQTKVSEEVINRFDTEQEVLTWVYLTDKGENLDKYYNNPQTVVSERSLERRKKVNSENNLIDYTDIPLNSEYLQSIRSIGLKIKQNSKWLNAVSLYADKRQVNKLKEQQFVKKIDLVSRFKYKRPEDKSLDERRKSQPRDIHSYDYGDSYTQLNQLNVPDAHDMGITGEGVLICLMDAGFNNLEHEAFNNINIIASWDFVNGDGNVDDEGDMGSGSHGTNTLSTIGGFKEGKLIGPAFNSDYLLAKTENTDSETPVEMDNWVAAMEWADSIGVDVTSTSLGYIWFDSPYEDYTWQDMDGNTTVITQAADLAVSKGIVVVNSAGNEGFNASHNTLGAPSDGDSVIAVGAVDSGGDRVYFSSVGNTVDGRIKPDVMAMGSGVTAASSFSQNSYTSVSGTSFSCPLTAGVAGLLLSFNPNLTPIQVRDIMRTTASNSEDPNREYGWGIVNTIEAINYAVDPDVTPPEQITDLQVSILTSNSLTIQWTVPYDSTVGGVVDFDIRYAVNPINSIEDFNNANPVEYEGEPDSTGGTINITVDNLDFSTTYYFAVRAADFWENWSQLSNITQAETFSAPDISVEPDSINKSLPAQTVSYDTVFISNVSVDNSTLDYEVTLENNTFPEDAAVKTRIINFRSQDDVSKISSKDNPVEVKGVSVRGSGGPDEFGYEWIDSFEPAGPEYQWDDISETGSELTDWQTTGSFDAEDEGYAVINANINFKFYGEVQNTVYVGSNGFIRFTEPTENSYTNDEIPDSDDPNGYISPLWNDLDGSETGNVYYEEQAGKLIIQYDSWGEYFDDGEFTYQVVLHSTGKIMFYYKELTGDLTSATVGIENPGGTDGLQIAYNAEFLSEELAVKISADPEWVLTNNHQGTIYNGNEIGIELEFITADYPYGNYSMDMNIESNDPDVPALIVPIQMTLEPQDMITVQSELYQGWNLISIPVELTDMSVSNIFNGSNVTVFGYDDIYQSVDELQMGNGFWVKMPAGETHSWIGTDYTNSIQLSEGWNIVGTFDEDVPVNNLVTDPTGILESNFFEFDGDYVIPDTLKVGKGYWIRAGQAGVLNYTDNSRRKKLIPGVEESWTSLQFIDSKGKEAKLYLGEVQITGAYQLPPLPPENSFDVRFKNGSFAHKPGSRRVIDISVKNYPLTLNVSDGSFHVKDAVTGKLVNSKIINGGKLTIKNSRINKLIIEPLNVPKKFRLFANYPNPFNPTTTIKYTIPYVKTQNNSESAELRATLNVYNVLGEEVAAIVDKKQKPGSYEVKFNASNLTSGVYFYRLKAGDFSASKKMLLLE